MPMVRPFRYNSSDIRIVSYTGQHVIIFVFDGGPGLLADELQLVHDWLNLLRCV